MEENQWKTKIGTGKQGRQLSTLTNVVGVNPAVLIKLYNIKGLDMPIERRDCQRGSKNYTWLNIVH